MTTILVIEDNLQNMYLMRFLLEGHGFTVLSATDGQEGIDMANRMRPDCILLDIQLPKLDGYGVATALRADSTLNNIPIIAVTSYAMMGDREKALACGATDYIEKPIDPAIFVDQIRKHLPMEPQSCQEL
jgi:two-component system, cell cycle response regulator DivK